MTAQASAPDLQSDSLSKLLKLREDVLADAHPRIKLPSSAIWQLRVLEQSLEEGPSIPPQPSSTAAPIQGNDSSARAPSTLADQPQPPTQSNHLSVPVQPSQPPVASDSSQQTAPAFLPFLLEKSPTLVQAEERSKRQREEQESHKASKEFTLRRQRLERALKAEYEKNGGDDKARNELKNHDGPLTVDVDKLFDQAIAIANAAVAPSVAANANAPASSQSSFDENSYYSSQVNEQWTSGSEEGELTPEYDPEQAGALGDDGPAAINNSHGTRQTQAAKPSHHLSSFADASDQPGSDKGRPRRLDGRGKFLRISPRASQCGT